MIRPKETETAKKSKIHVKDAWKRNEEKSENDSDDGDMVSAKSEKSHGLTRKKLKIFNLKLFFHKVEVSKEKKNMNMPLKFILLNLMLKVQKKHML
jgi:hypothetical protein